MAAGAFGERLAFTAGSGSISYGRLAAAARSAARDLREQRYRSLVYLGQSSLAFPLAMFAAAFADIPLVPLNYRLSDAQLREQIGLLDEPLLLLDEAYTPAVEGLEVPHRFTVPWSSEALAARPREPGFVSDDDSQPALILFTSGTGGAPKQAVLRHSHLTSYVVQSIDFGSARVDQAALTSVPPYHIAGAGAVISNAFAGRRVVYLPDFSPKSWLDTVREEGVTSAMVVPTMLARIVEFLGDRPAATPTLRHIAYGGARMPRPVIEAALERFPEAEFVNAYGLTETSSTIALLDGAAHRAAIASEDPEVRRRLASVGRPLPGVEIQIRDAAGQAVPIGQKGVLHVRGPQVSGEYRGIGSAIDAQGWFATGDIASFDDEGYLFVEGRADDIIIRGAENISPDVIEDVLLRHPDVREVAVVGAPDEEWGQEIVAVVVAEGAATPDAEELMGWVRASLRGSLTPREVIFVPELPYTPTGKLKRAQVLSEMDAT